MPLLHIQVIEDLLQDNDNEWYCRLDESNTSIVNIFV